MNKICKTCGVEFIAKNGQIFCGSAKKKFGCSYKNHRLFGKIALKSLKAKEYAKRKSKEFGYKFKSYKNSAKNRNIDFLLTEKEFLLFWNKSCFYCKDKIETIGIDRIDNEKGYTQNNIVPCCIVCNRMKLSYNQKEFINKCKQIAINFSSAD